MGVWRGNRFVYIWGNFVEQGRLEVDTKYFLFKRRIALIRTQGKKKYRNRQIFEGSKSEKMDAL